MRNEESIRNRADHARRAAAKAKEPRWLSYSENKPKEHGGDEVISLAEALVGVALEFLAVAGRALVATEDLEAARALARRNAARKAAVELEAARQRLAEAEAAAKATQK